MFMDQSERDNDLRLLPIRKQIKPFRPVEGLIMSSYIQTGQT